MIIFFVLFFCYKIFKEIVTKWLSSTPETNNNFDISMEKGEDELSNNSDMIPCDSDDMDKEDENDSKSHDDSDEEYQLKPKSTFIHLSLILQRNKKGINL